MSLAPPDASFHSFSTNRSCPCLRLTILKQNTHQIMIRSLERQIHPILPFFMSQTIGESTFRGPNLGGGMEKSNLNQGRSTRSRRRSRLSFNLPAPKYSVQPLSRLLMSLARGRIPLHVGVLLPLIQLSHAHNDLSQSRPFLDFREASAPP